MTAFLKIDTCNTCHHSLPWEFVPAVMVNGKALPGTGVWRTPLVNGQCAACLAASELQREKERQGVVRRTALIELLGGEKPYREFTFERFQLAPGNRRAFERSKDFNPATENLYLWGACGVGKTHLASAMARRCFEETLAVTIVHA